MKKETLVIGFFFVIICGLFIVFSPDRLSMVFTIIQSVFMILGFVFGIFKVSRYSRAFQIAKFTIDQTKQEVQTDDLWVAITRNDDFFHLDDLNSDFEEYKKRVTAVRTKGNRILPDIEDSFNEDALSIKSWRSAINQVPETLTGIGILGTFVGLMIGVGGIGFSSVAAAVTSLQVLINGIEIAFYTSIVGIILSICFNLVYKFAWNNMMRDLYIFIDEFHKNLIPSEEEQLRDLEGRYYSMMLDESENGAKGNI